MPIYNEQILIGYLPRERMFKMEKSYAVLKHAIETAGAKKVASDLRLSSALIYKWCQDPAETPKKLIPSGSINPLDRIQQIYKSTGDLAVISWICQMAEGFFVQNPKAAIGTLEEEDFKNTQRLIQEFSEVLQTTSESFHNGRRINKKEARLIRKEWEDVKRVGESFVKACESGLFDKQGK